MEVLKSKCKKNFGFMVVMSVFFMVINFSSLPAFSATPLVSTVSPDRAFNNVSTSVTITGENFEPGAKVSLLKGLVPPLGSYITPGAADNVQVSGNYAYIADGAAGIQIIDISDPANPQFAGAYDTGDVSAIYVSGNYAYVGDWNEAFLYILDISNPSNPVLVSSTPTYGQIMDLTVIGNYAYLAADALITVDVSNPEAPGITDFAYLYSTHAIYGSGNYLYVAGENAFHILNLNNPAIPEISGSVDMDLWSNDIHVSGNYAYVLYTDWVDNGFHIFDVSNPGTPQLVNSYITEDLTWGINVADNTVFLTSGPSGLQTIDVTNPLVPLLTGTYVMTGISFGVDVSGAYVYIADNDGISIIRPNSPVTNVNVLDSTTLTATFPAPLIEGLYSILITNPAGEEGILYDGYEAIGLSSVITDIKANASDGPLVINTGELLKVTISLNPNEASGYQADWWVYAVSDSIGTYWYKNGSGWNKSDTPITAYEGPLTAISNFKVLESSTLPQGNYDFYFQVDDKNGIKEGTAGDTVHVTIQ